MLQRALAILAAMLLVGAVALAMLGPPEVPLGQLLFMLDHDMTEALSGSIQHHVASWCWDDIVMPLLQRPAWLLPASLGLVCAGVSLTLASRRGPSQSRHRRS
jgi:hypothetical protein